MAAPSCPRCSDRCELDSRNPTTWTCRACGHTFTEGRADGYADRARW